MVQWCFNKRKYISITAVALSMLIVLLGCFCPNSCCLTGLTVAVSLITIALLSCQLSLLDKTHKFTGISLLTLLVMYFAIGKLSADAYSLSNQQNYINAAALGVTMVQLIWEEEEKKKQLQDKDD